MAKLIQAERKLEVKKSEAIVKARYKLSPLAIKFISVIISNLKRSDDVNEEYVLKVKDFQELTGQKTKRIYELIDEALNDLLKNPLTIPLGDEKNSVLKANWVSGAVYNEGEVRFMIYPKLRPFLLEVKEKFLKYKLENILSLRSSYVIRLYEILKDWLELNKRYGNKSEKIISVDELREILEIPKSYQYSSHIKKLILEKAKSEFSEHTDIIFDYEEIKTGRKVTHLKFIIKLHPKKMQTNNRLHKTDNDFTQWRKELQKKDGLILKVDNQVFEIRDGLLTKNDKILDKEEAWRFWKFLFKNKDKIKFLSKEDLKKEVKEEMKQKILEAFKDKEFKAIPVKIDGNIEYVNANLIDIKDFKDIDNFIATFKSGKKTFAMKLGIDTLKSWLV
jgi:plasmid replication initiation protein